MSATSLEPDEGFASPHQKEVLAQLRERLVGRRSRAEQRSQALDELELSQSFDYQPAESTPPRRGGRGPRTDEDGVWHIKPENVALLEGAYPRQLVQRFLDGVVRERVAVLGRVRARRYFKQHVDVRPKCYSTLLDYTALGSLGCKPRLSIGWVGWRVFRDWRTTPPRTWSTTATARRRGPVCCSSTSTARARAPGHTTLPLRLRRSRRNGALGPRTKPLA